MTSAADVRAEIENVRANSVKGITPIWTHEAAIMKMIEALIDYLEERQPHGSAPVYQSYYKR